MAFSLLPYFLNRWHYEISAKLLNRSNFRVELGLKSEGAHGALFENYLDKWYLLLDFETTKGNDKLNDQVSYFV
jgi:hypothetical protein